MKINTKIYNTLTNEPVEVQEINNKKVEIHYMNDTAYLSQYVSRGRFYLWTSNDVNYKLLVEKGFYEKVGYFFEKGINEIWISFLEEVGAINKKISRIFLAISLAITVLIVAVIAIFFPEQLMMGVIGALFATLIINMIQSTKINKIVREKNIKAQDEIRAILTDDGFNKLIADQEEYIKDYFKFDENEEAENDEQELIEENEIKEEIEEIEIVEEDTNKEVEIGLKDTEEK